MSVRQVVTRSGLHVRGHFPSYKMGRMVSWESQLERKCIWHLEYSPAVVGYEEQPLELHYVDGEGKARRAIPDFRATLADGCRLLVEVKPAAKLRNPSLAARLQAVAKAAQEQGYVYHVVTELELGRNPLLPNLRDLIYHRPPLSDRIHYEALLTQIPRGGLAAGDAAQRVGDMATLRRMQSLHLVHMNLRLPFSADLAVTPYEGGRHDLLLA